MSNRRNNQLFLELHFTHCSRMYLVLNVVRGGVVDPDLALAHPSQQAVGALGQYLANNFRGFLKQGLRKMFLNDRTSQKPSHPHFLSSP